MVHILGQSTEDGRETIGNMWNKYRDMTMPSGALTQQIMAMRHAFHAGAHAMFMLYERLPDDREKFFEGMNAYQRELLQELARQRPTPESMAERKRNSGG